MANAGESHHRRRAAGGNNAVAAVFGGLHGAASLDDDLLVQVGDQGGILVITHIKLNVLVRAGQDNCLVEIVEAVELNCLNSTAQGELTDVETTRRLGHDGERDVLCVFVLEIGHKRPIFFVKILATEGSAAVVIDIEAHPLGNLASQLQRVENLELVAHVGHADVVDAEVGAHVEFVALGELDLQIGHTLILRLQRENI